MHVGAPRERDLANAWAAQVLSRRFLDTQRLDKALVHMCDKPIGYYVFMRPESVQGVGFAALLRYRTKTVRYDIRPNDDYRKYIVSTPEAWEMCYDDIAQFIERWDESYASPKVETGQESAGALSRGDLADMNTRIQDFLDRHEHNNVGSAFLGMTFPVFKGLPGNALRAMGVTDKFISDHGQMVETAERAVCHAGRAR